MTHYLGIDPGKHGALALLNESGEIVSLEDMPDNLTEVVKTTKEFGFIERAAIEKPFPGGKMSSVSCMTFGMGIGELRGVLAALSIPFVMVKPQDWQRVFSVKGKSRGNDSIAQCLRLYPDAPLIGANDKRYDGRSDALLIARWLWKQEMIRKVS